MTDRINSLTVVLEADIREDDCRALQAAISQLRGVLSVRTHVSDYESVMAEDRAKQKLTEKLWKVLGND